MLPNATTNQSSLMLKFHRSQIRSLLISAELSAILIPRVICMKFYTKYRWIRKFGIYTHFRSIVDFILLSCLRSATWRDHIVNCYTDIQTIRNQISRNNYSHYFFYSMDNYLLRNRWESIYIGLGYEVCFTLMNCLTSMDGNLKWISLNFQPSDCAVLIERLKSCSEDELLRELSSLRVWNWGKVCWYTLIPTINQINISVYRGHSGRNRYEFYWIQKRFTSKGNQVVLCHQYFIYFIT